MGRLYRNESGFSAIEAFIIVLVIGVVGGAGFFVYKSNDKTKVADNLSVAKSKGDGSENQPSSGANKSYVDPNKEFSVEYPASWTKATDTKTTAFDGTSSNTTLTSKSGTVLHLDTNNGGKGGECQAAAADTPFHAGNTCSSHEYLSKEIVPINNVYYGTEHADSTGNVTFSFEKPATIMLVTSHYADPSGTSSYIIGLTQSTPELPVMLNTPTMGLSIPQEWFTVYDSSGKFYPYIYAYATGSSPDFLTGADAAVIKTILRSVKVTI